MDDDLKIILQDDFWIHEATWFPKNPYRNKAQEKLMERAVNFHLKRDLIWLQSSGTENLGKGQIKLIGFKKKAILVAAASVNHFFDLKSEDLWANSLPIFHIGGLSVFARAHASGAKVVNLWQSKKWNSKEFVSQLESHKINLVSLVPTQVFDIVESRLASPERLKFVFVGGGALNPSLYHRARALGWPLIPSYGMTETSALVAAAHPQSLRVQGVLPEMELLPHLQLQKGIEGKYRFLGDSIGEGRLLIGESDSHWEPFHGLFETDDQLLFNGKNLSVVGRMGELVKILGESVSLVQVQHEVENFFGTKNLFVLTEESPRIGYRLVLVVMASQIENILEKTREYNQSVWPPGRISAVCEVPQIPRNALGKVKLSEIRKIIGENFLRRFEVKSSP